jgi:antitoxin component YwqK of YwqJK toxin-antitoxin module
LKPHFDYRKGRHLFRILPLLFALSLIVAAYPSCGVGNSQQESIGAGAGSEQGVEPVSGEFVTGPEVELARATIPVEGGTVTVDKPGDPLDGLSIEVPEATYAEDRTFVISSASIESNSFDPALDPATPLVYVDDGGGGAKKIMLFSVPLDLAAEEIAKGFLYDSATGWLEETPTVRMDGDRITSAVPHLSSIVWAKSSSTRMQQLAQDGNILSGFRPGVDDWEFPNEGSIIAPDGHSMGQCQSAAWYYTKKKMGERAKPLYGLYDNNGGEKTPIWEDDSYGYRLASRLQVEKDWYDLNKLLYHEDIEEEEVWNDVANGIYQTRFPVLLTVFPERDLKGGLTLLAWHIDGDRVYVADPNFPGESGRYLKYTDGQFEPYISGPPSRGDKSKQTTYYFFRRSFTITYSDQVIMDRLWYELQEGVIGWDKFPAYKIQVYDEKQNKDVDLADGYQSDQDNISISAYEDTQDKNILKVNVWRDGDWLEKDKAGMIQLKEGTNKLGIYVSGIQSTGCYLDFRWVTVEYKKEARELKTERTYYSDNPQQVEIEYVYYEENAQRVRHGFYRTYHINGNLKADANYKDGLGDGPQKTYWENGKLQEEWEMKAGIQEGVHKYYDESGKLWREEVWVDNMITESKEY